MKISILTLSLVFALSNQIMAATGARVASTKRAVRATSNTTSTTVSTTEEDKTPAVCEKIFYDCMDKKTIETLMQNEMFYDDYNDMITDIYNGMSSPAFKCIYNENIKDLYGTYYYNQTDLEADGTEDKIKKNSIEYYAFLKQNASDIATKKITANLVHTDVLNLAGITVTPLNAKVQSVPNVSYKFTILNPTKAFNLNKEYCLDPEQNKSLEDCAKLKKSIADTWKNMEPNTMAKSCQDYETFLIDKRSQAKQAAETFILSLKTQIINAINEYNAKIEAEKELF